MLNVTVPRPTRRRITAGQPLICKSVCICSAITRVNLTGSSNSTGAIGSCFLRRSCRTGCSKAMLERSTLSTISQSNASPSTARQKSAETWVRSIHTLPPSPTQCRSALSCLSVSPGLRLLINRLSIAFHAKALELGAANEGDPGDRAAGAFFAYFRDLDGNKFCAYNMNL